MNPTLDSIITTALADGFVRLDVNGRAIYARRQYKNNADGSRTPFVKFEVDNRRSSRAKVAEIVAA